MLVAAAWLLVRSRLSIAISTPWLRRACLLHSFGRIRRVWTGSCRRTGIVARIAETDILASPDGSIARGAVGGLTLGASCLIGLALHKEMHCPGVGFATQISRPRYALLDQN